ncbi:MAG: ACP S-malonyltransferase [bacterium]|nr:ACP S-malonyltransferase [bacterium]
MSKIAFLFPGQGSQRPGMGDGFLASQVAAEAFEEANDRLGFDLQKLCMEGPADQLTLTQHAQPAILTVSVIAFRVMVERMEITPLAAAGHSLGEYSALVAAGVLDFGDAVEAVYYRGKYMQEAVPVGQGGMAAILGMNAADLEELCAAEAKGQFVAPANYNCHGQIVISGHLEAVQRVLARAKGKLLEVSAPFHSQLMAPAAALLNERLKGLNFEDAAWPIVTNAENRHLRRGSDFLDSLVLQVTAPVRWDTGVGAMIDEGADAFIEFGEGKVLSGLMKRIDKTKPVYSCSSIEEADNLYDLISEYL